MTVEGFYNLKKLLRSFTFWLLGKNYSLKRNHFMLKISFFNCFACLLLHLFDLEFHTPITLCPIHLLDIQNKNTFLFFWTKYVIWNGKDLWSKLLKNNIDMAKYKPFNGFAIGNALKAGVEELQMHWSIKANCVVKNRKHMMMFTANKWHSTPTSSTTHNNHNTTTCSSPFMAPQAGPVHRRSKEWDCPSVVA